jgi:hypothetical protein
LGFFRSDQFAVVAAKYLDFRAILDARQFAHQCHGGAAEFAGGSWNRTGGAMHERKTLSSKWQRKLPAVAHRNESKL